MFFMYHASFTVYHPSKKGKFSNVFQLGTPALLYIQNGLNYAVLFCFQRHKFFLQRLNVRRSPRVLDEVVGYSTDRSPVTAVVDGVCAVQTSIANFVWEIYDAVHSTVVPAKRKLLGASARAHLKWVW